MKKIIKKSGLLMRPTSRPIPPRGRKTAYPFWKIAEGEGMIFEGAEMKNIVSAAYQFKQKYGGDYTSRTLEDGSVVVYCLEAPTNKHPGQLEEEWLVANEKRDRDE